MFTHKNTLLKKILLMICDLLIIILPINLLTAKTYQKNLLILFI
jgi:hypothetical protein